MINNLLDVEKGNYEKNVFRGVVVDNNDPLKLERIKVSIVGLYESNDTSVLPWCVSFKRMFFGSGAGYGEFGVPRLGSVVAVMLQHGDPHFPVYMGAILQSGNEVAEAATNYPHRYGFKDPVGNIFYVDMQSGEVKFQHKSGTHITINNDGSVNITTEGNVTETIKGNLTLTVTGNYLLDVTGTVDLMSDGTMDLTATGNLGLTAPRIDANQT